MIRLVKSIYHLIIAFIAALWFGFPSRNLTVIGVTGTDGKTTTTTLIYEMLKAAGLAVSMISTVHAVIAGKEYDTGFHVTTPTAFTIQKYLRAAAQHGDTHVVLEVTSHGLAQHRVSFVQFAVGVLTNITHEHLDWHGSFKAYMDTKLTLLRGAKVAILNRDEADVYNYAIPRFRNKKLVTYALRRDATITPKTFPIKPKLVGEFNKYNCLAAVSVGYVLGIDKKILLATVHEFEGVIGRMEVLQTVPFTVIVDFAHTPNAIEQVLKTVRKLTKKKLIHVFGAAGLRDAAKRPMMGAASARYADRIILTEEDYRTEDVWKIMDQIQEGIASDNETNRFQKRAEAITYALSRAKPGDLVIITGKGHEKSLCRGTKEYPWSDQAHVRKVLKRSARANA